MFLSGTVLCTINTLVEHGLKNAVPVKTRCASDHFAAPQQTPMHESFTFTRSKASRSPSSARVRRGARNPQSFHSTLCGPDLPPVSPPKTRDRRYFTKAVETRCGKVKTKVHTLHAGLYML